MTLAKTSLLVALGLTTVPCWSQFLTFNKSYGGSNEENVNAMINGTDGGYVMVGSTGSYGPNHTDQLTNGYMVKTDDAGTIQWAFAIGGSTTDRLSSVATLSDGGYMVVGNLQISFANSDMLLMRFTSSGALDWAKRIGTTAKDEGAQKIIALGSDDFLILGWRATPGGSGDDNILATKINGDGAVLWATECGSSHGDDPNDIVRTDDGGYAVVGFQYFLSTVNMLIVKLDSAGLYKWDRTYQTIGFQTGGAALITTTNGDLVIAGNAGYGVGTSDLVITKVDSTGFPIWRTAFTNGHAFGPAAILAKNGGGFLVTGSTYYYPDTVLPILDCVLLDENGAMLGHSAHGSVSSSYEGRVAVENSDGSFTVAGEIKISGSGQSFDLDLIRCSSANMGLGSACDNYLDNISQATLPIPTMSQTLSPLAAPSLSVVSLSWTATPGGNEVLLCTNVGLEEDMTEVPELSVYPNPSADKVTICLHHDLAASTLEIINATGAVVRRASLFGSTAQVVDISNLSSGVYVCRVLLDSGVAVQSVFEIDR